MYVLAEEGPEDFWEVEALFDTCFAPGREALSSYRLREGVARVGSLCLTARDADGILAGAVRHWPVWVGPVRVGPVRVGPVREEAVREEAVPALLLGPIAVHPTRQGEGLGADLMEHAMGAAAALGWARVLLVGDAPYYGRFGFFQLRDVEMPPPTNPARVLGRALRPGAWEGVAGPVQRWA